MAIVDELTKHLDEVLDEYQELIKRSEDGDGSDLPEVEVMRFNINARAVIHRVADSRSVYVDQCKRIINQDLALVNTALSLSAIVDSLKANVAAGYLESYQERIHGELFGDFLEMAEHYLGEGQKEAAATIGGGALEAHLRQLCVKAGIPTTFPSKNGGELRKKGAGVLNQELAEKDVYPGLDKSSVTSWIKLRNMAAHGRHDEYELSQVRVMITGIRDFITRNPA